MIFSSGAEPVQTLSLEGIMRTKREKYLVDMRRQKKIEIFNERRFKKTEDIRETNELSSKREEKFKVLSLPQLLDLLKDALYYNNVEETEDILTFLSHNFLREDDDNERRIFLERNYEQIAVSTLMNDYFYKMQASEAVTNTLTLVINCLASKNDIFLETFMKCGILGALNHALSKTNNLSIINDVLTCLSNMLLETKKDYRSQMLESEIFQNLTDIAPDDLDSDEALASELVHFLFHFMKSSPKNHDTGVFVIIADNILSSQRIKSSNLLLNIFFKAFNDYLSQNETDLCLLAEKTNIVENCWDILLSKKETAIAEGVLVMVGDVLDYIIYEFYNNYNQPYFMDDFMEICQGSLRLLQSGLRISIRIYAFVFLESLAAIGSAAVSEILKYPGLKEELFSYLSSMDPNVTSPCIKTTAILLRNANKNQIKDLMNLKGEDLLQRLCKFMKEEANIKKENDALNLLKALDSVLNCGEGSAENNEGKENVYKNKFMSYGGTPYLENLQSHEKESVYEQAGNIIEKYFNYE